MIKIKVKSLKGSVLVEVAATPAERFRISFPKNRLRWLVDDWNTAVATEVTIACQHCAFDVGGDVSGSPFILRNCVQPVRILAPPDGVPNRFRWNRLSPKQGFAPTKYRRHIGFDDQSFSFGSIASNV